MKWNPVVKNATWIITCRIVEAVLHLVITMLTSRYLGPSHYGTIHYADSLAAFALPLMHLGIRNILVKEMVASPDQKGTLLGSGLLMNLLSSLLCLLGITAFARIANPGEPITVIVCLLYSTTLIFQAVEILQHWFQERLMSKYVSLSMLAAYVLMSLYQVYILIQGKGILWFAVTDSLKHLLIALFLALAYWGFRADPLRLSWDACKRLLSEGRSYILSNLMIMIFAQTDKIMLKQMAGDTVTGYYAAAVNCANLANFVFIAILDSVRPGIFRSRQESITAFESSIRRVYGVIGLVSLLQCICVTVLAPVMIRILYGADYAPASSLLQLVVWFTAFAHLGQVRDLWVLAEHKQTLLWKINVFGAISNVLLNLLLIPIWGAVGAAIASLACQFITNVAAGFLIPAMRRGNQLMLMGLTGIRQRKPQGG